MTADRVIRGGGVFVFFAVVMLVCGGCVGRKKQDSAATSRVIVCIPGGKDVAKMGIPASYLTHIYYSYVHISEDGNPYLADPKDEENLYYLTSLKDRNPQLKILLRVGGWNGSKYFSDVARTDSSRRLFASRLVVMVTMYNLDGIDIDWESPGQVGAGNHYLPEDRWNFSLLLEDLRVALNRMAFLKNDNLHYILTIDAGASTTWLEHVAIDDVLQVVDYINVMTYDYYGRWDNRTGHVSNLFGSSCEPYGNSVDQSVRLFEQAGVPPAKIVIGGILYGRWWNKVEKLNNGLCQVASGSGGQWDYQVIVDSVMKIPGYKALWDKKAKAPYLWNAGEAIFVSYENPRSLEAKENYIKRKKLGGIMLLNYSGGRDRELLEVIHNGLKR